MQETRGDEIWLLLILDIGTRGMSDQRHAPTALYPRVRTPVPIVQEAGWAPELVLIETLEKK
jgi:hypothetical protein